MQPAAFFRTIFGAGQGFVCLAIKTKEFKEVFYRYPEQLREMHEYVERNKYLGNIYFCPQLLGEARRLKTNVSQTTCVWADLDTCDPGVLLVRPSITLESSPGRYQAFWAFDEPRRPEEGEDIARRIAYHHADEGADRSGWDLTQLLRIPSTRNFKYGDGASAPEVKVQDQADVKYRPDDFSEYPAAEGYEYTAIPFPTFIVEAGAVILERYSYKISGAAHSLFYEEPGPETDRSQALYRLEMLCFEAGMTPEEVFQTARDSKLNKWGDRHDLLWRDVCRANSNHGQNTRIAALPPTHEPPLLSDKEKEAVQSTPGFVERFIEWAKTLGDAAEQYHQASAFILLSSMLANSIVLPTSFGTLVPNLWFCILADTTITRKSTAMGIGMDLLEELDDTLLMATDGSIEGLSEALSERPGRVSLFFRDEFTGLLEQMTKKDYMAGMPEFFAHLYDGRTQVRRLRKGEIRIKNPRLIIYAGGIRTRMQELVTYEHVSSGFIPRFVFVTAASDPTKVKPLGPPSEQNQDGRDDIKRELEEVRQQYNSQIPIVVGGKVTGVQERQFQASLTQGAWNRFNRIDQTLMEIGVDSGDYKDILTPTYARLSFSMLKASVLIAAARTRATDLVVEEEDIIRAAYYGEDWRRYAQDIVSNVNRGRTERKIELIANAVQKHGQMKRSDLMQGYHLTSQEMTLYQKTLEERGLVHVTQHGRAVVLQWLPSEGETTLRVPVGGKK